MTLPRAAARVTRARHFLILDNLPYRKNAGTLGDGCDHSILLVLWALISHFADQSRFLFFFR